MTDSADNRNLPEFSRMVFERSGEILTDSKIVASEFDKEHKHVLEAIREMECSQEFRGSNFRPNKIKDLTGESTSHVDITEAGLLRLIMHFSGPKAAAKKEQFIYAFQWMKAKLQEMAARMPTHPEALRGWAQALEDKQRLEERVQKMQPHVDAQKRLEAAEGSMSLRDAAKRLKLKVNDLSDYLIEWKLCYRDGNRRIRPYGKYTVQRDGMKTNPLGYFDMVGLQAITEGGVSRDMTCMVITAKGLGMIARKLGRRLDEDQPGLF